MNRLSLRRPSLRRVRLVLLLATLAAMFAVSAGTALAGSGRCQRTCIDPSPSALVQPV